MLNSGYLRDAEVLRFFLISSHYRGPINYSLAQIEQADAALTRLYTALRGVSPQASSNESDATRAFVAAMDDDFNTPEAIASLQSLASEINRAKASSATTLAATLGAELIRLGAVLGVLQQDPEDFLRKSKRSSEAHAGDENANALSGTEIESLIAERAAARRSKNFKRSDEIRKLLSDQSVILEDKPDGSTTWRRD